MRPNLEFAVPVWNPYFKKDIEKLEDIQQKATRLAPKLKKREYLDRLIMALETRRKRGDLIQFYKILNGFDHVQSKIRPVKIFRLRVT